MSTFGLYREISDFEANLYRQEEPSALVRFLGMRIKKGEIEISTYNDGHKKIEVELEGVEVPNGSTVTAIIDGAPTCEVQVNHGKARVKQRTTDGIEIPEVSRGSVAEIHYQGEIILSGTFKPD